MQIHGEILKNRDFVHIEKKKIYKRKTKKISKFSK